MKDYLKAICHPGILILYAASIALTTSIDRNWFAGTYGMLAIWAIADNFKDIQKNKK